MATVELVSAAAILRNIRNLLLHEPSHITCRYFTRMEIRAKSGKLVPVLLKPSFVSAYELLIKAREACRVPSENPFLFGCPRVLSAYRPATCLQLHAIKCGAKDPKLLSLLKIRRHFRTMLQLINLDKDEAEQILGPGNQLRRLKQDSDLLLDDSEMYLDGKQGVTNTPDLSQG